MPKKSNGEPQAMSLAFFLFILPLLFTFGVHIISSKYYTLKTTSSIERKFSLKQARNLIIDENHYTKFLPDFLNYRGDVDLGDSRYYLSSFLIFGGQCEVVKGQDDLIYLKNGKSFMVSFKLRCHSYNAEYVYSITPKDKNNEEDMKVILESEIQFKNQIVRAMAKIFQPLFARRDAQSLRLLDDYLSVSLFFYILKVNEQ